MAFEAGKNTELLMGDVALSGTMNQFNGSGATQAIRVTPFKVDDAVFIAGLSEGSVSLGGMFDRTASDQEIEAALGTDTVLSVLLGDTIGDGAYVATTIPESYSIRSANNDAVRVNASFMGDGPLRGGVTLHQLEAESGTGNYASVDQSASTSFGSVANLHVTAFSGTSAVVRVQHSTNNSTWTDLITFSTVTGATSQRSSTSGTVHRYVRAAITSGSFSSITFAVCFARNYR